MSTVVYGRSDDLVEVVSACERCGKDNGKRRRCLSCHRLVCFFCSYIWTDSGRPAYACDGGPRRTGQDDCSIAEREYKRKLAVKGKA